MASKKSDTIPSPSDVAEVPDFGLDINDASEIQLHRRWYQPDEAAQDFVFLLPLQRSENVRELFPNNMNKEETELRVWACLLLRNVASEDRLIACGKDERNHVKFVDVRAGEVVYMFEKPILRDALQDAQTTKRPIAIRTLGKTRKTPKGMAWNWEVKRFPKPVQYTAPEFQLPSASDRYLAEEASPEQ